MSDAVVVDTNVAVVANGKHEPAPPECIAASIEALRGARQQLILVDEGYLIFDEYRRWLSHSGQPGVGDAFFKWLWENQANPERCRRVPITPINDSETDFEEFPTDVELAMFDAADRKFVAVALASGLSPTVLNASDSDWWNYRVPLENSGIIINFLCPDLMQDQE
jgi:hypothetical protein